jgi:hypothetical protein
VGAAPSRAIVAAIISDAIRSVRNLISDNAEMDATAFST